MKTLIMLMGFALASAAHGQADQKARLHKADPVNAKSKAKTAEPCCSVTAVNSATGAVTLKDLKTGQVLNVTVKDKGRLGALRVGQKVDKNL